MLSKTASMITSAVLEPRVAHLGADAPDAFGRRLRGEPSPLDRAVVVLADRRRGRRRGPPAPRRSARRSGRRSRTPSRCRCPSFRRRRWRRWRRAVRRCPCRTPGTLARARSAKNAWMSALACSDRAHSKNSSRSRRQPSSKGSVAAASMAAIARARRRQVAAHLRASSCAAASSAGSASRRAAACRRARGSSGAARRARRPRANATAPWNQIVHDDDRSGPTAAPRPP